MAKIFSFVKQHLDGQSGRKSNFELLRIISMFLVLIVHADFLSLGYPTLDELNTQQGVVITKGLFESASIICVNLFVLISGYFMIKLRWSKISSYIYQCLFYSICIYVLFITLGLCELNFSNTAQTLLIGWFMKNQFVSNYLALMLLAPLINAIFERGTQQQVQKGMLGFTFVAFVMNWLIPVQGGGFLGGYSIIHLVFIYCIGSFIRLFPSLKCFNYKAGVYLLSYIAFIAINTLFFYCIFRYSLPWNVWGYNSPIVVSGSIVVFLFFKSINIQSSFVTFIAQSSFAVFLLHTNSFIFPFFKEHVNFLYNNNEGWLVLAKLFVYLLSIFVVSILLDQIRKLTYNSLVSLFNTKDKF